MVRVNLSGPKSGQQIAAVQIAKPNRNPKSQEVRGTLCNLEERERPKSQISNRRGSRGDKSQVQNPRLGQVMFVAVAVVVVVAVAVVAVVVVAVVVVAVVVVVVLVVVAAAAAIVVVVAAVGVAVSFVVVGSSSNGNRNKNARNPNRQEIAAKSQQIAAQPPPAQKSGCRAPFWAATGREGVIFCAGPESGAENGRLRDFCRKSAPRAPFWAATGRESVVFRAGSESGSESAQDRLRAPGRPGFEIAGAKSQRFQIANRRNRNEIAEIAGPGPLSC